MTPAEVKSPSGPRVGPGAALLLSAFVLPGLGQILTGRKIRGALMIVSVTLWLPAALFKLLKDLNLVMPKLVAQAAEGPVGLSDLQALMQPLAGGLAWFFLPLLAVWFWTMGDSVIYLIENRKKDEINIT